MSKLENNIKESFQHLSASTGIEVDKHAVCNVPIRLGVIRGNSASLIKFPWAKAENDLGNMIHLGKLYKVKEEKKGTWVLG